MPSDHYHGQYLANLARHKDKCCSFMQPTHRCNGPRDMLHAVRVTDRFYEYIEEEFVQSIARHAAWCNTLDYHPFHDSIHSQHLYSASVRPSTL